MAEFQEALTSIKEGIKDLAQLNVRTYTGTISVDAAGGDTKEFMDKAFSGGTLVPVALTRIMLDGDADQFISSDDSIKPEVYQAHLDAIRAGQESRLAAFNLFTGQIKALIANLK